MAKFTEKQLAFIQHKALGYTNAKAMVAAGYSANTASQQGSVLSKRPEMQAAIKKARLAMPKAERNAAAVRDVPLHAPKSVSMQARNYADPEKFLRDLMNNEAVPLLIRKDAAKDLMPYCHSKLGEKGKKETATDKAHAIAKGKVKTKFRTQKAPPLPPGVGDLTARRHARNNG